MFGHLVVLARQVDTDFPAPSSMVSLCADLHRTLFSSHQNAGHDMLNCRLSVLVPFAEIGVGHLFKFIVQVACMLVCKCDKVAAHTSCPTNAAKLPKPFLLQAGGSQHCCGKCVCVVGRRAWAILRCANFSCCIMLISCLKFLHPDASYLAIDVLHEQYDKCIESVPVHKRPHCQQM